MPISVSWGTKIINVPKSVLTLVQSTPTEILSLDLNWFRLQLKDLEDGEEGMNFLDTHRHNPPVDVGGVTLSRVIEIINDYTITFEDGQYAVNLTGANSNIADRVNVNQVSVRSANSAGLVTSAAIEYGEYGGGVTIDVINGSSGVIYPIGTPRKPVNNITDALFICTVRGFNVINVIGNLTLQSGDIVSGYHIRGSGAGFNSPKTTITFVSGCVGSNTTYEKCNIVGRQGGESMYNECIIGNITNTHCEFDHCGLVGPVQVVSSGWTAGHTTTLNNCYTTQDWFVVDYANSPIHQTYTNFSGKIKFTNITHANASVVIMFDAGTIWIDSTCTAGSIVVRGIGDMIDDSNGTTVNIDGFTQASIIQYSSFNGGITLDVLNGSNGTNYPKGTEEYPVDNITDAITICDSRGIRSLYLRGDYNLSPTDDVSGFHIYGEDADSTTLTLSAGNTTTGAQMHNLTLTGTCGGRMEVTDCTMMDITGFCASGGSSYVRSTILGGTIQLRQIATDVFHFIDCVSIGSDDNPTIIDVNGCTADIMVRNFSGSLKIINATQGNIIEVYLNSGEITLDSTVTNAVIDVGGVGVLINESSLQVSQDGLMNKTTVADSILNTNLSVYDSPNTVGMSLTSGVYNGILYINSNGTSGTEYPVGLFETPVNNMIDANVLIVKYGLNILHFHSDMVIPHDFDLSNHIVESHNTFVDTLTLSGGCLTDNTVFRNVKITGHLNGEVTCDHCFLSDVDGVSGNISNTVFDGNISCVQIPGHVLQLTNCRSNSQMPVNIDMGSSSLNGINSFGMFNIKNVSLGTVCNMHSGFGYIILDSTCSSGDIMLQGFGKVVNNSNGSNVINGMVDGILTEDNFIALN